MAELQIADVRAQVSFSLATDFENSRVFRPDPEKEKLVHTMLDQVVAWASVMKPLRAGSSHEGSAAAE